MLMGVYRGSLVVRPGPENRQGRLESRVATTFKGCTFKGELPLLSKSHIPEDPWPSESAPSVQD